MYMDKFDSDDNMKIYVPKISTESLAASSFQESEEVKIYNRQSGCSEKRNNAASEGHKL